MIQLAMVVCLLAACGGGEEDEGKARADQCERMRAHLVDLRLASAQHLDKSELVQHRAAMTQAMGPAFLDSCTRDMTAAQVACALAARDSQAAVECSTVSSGN